ncbi:hypothetical protein [Caldanaerobius polysaccharolyticus]|uniref:hypothetical protein n=1 Tax=Caldanaerobius polysaccharolyticus TaxID=44256 RepID=UPI0004792D8A|nr:hypothetical protein [Caldanaerobius polysaccharolyticus]
MKWEVYRVIFRVRSPLHIGFNKVGNLQRTRHYVTGRVMWGALTARLTRMKFLGKGPVVSSEEYQCIGRDLDENIAFTYFYPAIRRNSDYQILWPWENEDDFRRRLLGSYVSTALDYSQQAAANEALHEIEFISPNTQDTGEPIYLMGYIFEKKDTELEWKKACEYIQLGGERGYGFGKLELADMTKIQTSEIELFNGAIKFKNFQDRPLIHLHVADSPQSYARLLAHTKAINMERIEGIIEPLVVREWRSNAKQYRYAGQYVDLIGVCFAPGSKISKSADFAIGRFGIWYPALAKS